VDSLAGEHGIEAGGDFAVMISDQEPELSRAVVDPGSGGVCGDAQQLPAASGVLDYEQDVSR
jgi:hypothetical protein